MKKIISYLIAVMMLVTLIPCTAFAEEDACDHVWSEWWEHTADAECGDSYESRYCEECSEEEFRNIVKGTGNHVWGDWEIWYTATCSEDGLEYRYCDACWQRDELIIPATGIHCWGDWELWTEATCVSEGTECRYCMDCWEQEEKIIPATGKHNWSGWELYEEATCIDKGSKKRECTDCYKEETKVIPATGKHTWSDWSPTPGTTCIKGGKTERYCDVCAKTERKDFPATGKHNWSGWLIWDKASCYNTGYLVNYCYKCTAEKTKEIDMIKSVKISATSYVYNGKAKTPSATVKDISGKKLVKGTDYTVKYKNSAGKVVKKPVKVGKYKAVITFKGNYKGSVTKSFKIKPVSTAIKTVTAGNDKFTVKWNKKTTQVTGYQIRYSTSSEFTKKTTGSAYVKSAKTTSKTIKNLKNKKKYYVQIRTYKTVGKTKIYSKWSKTQTVKTK